MHPPFFYKKTTVMRADIYSYIVQNNPSGAMRMIQSNGLQPGRNNDEAATQIASIVCARKQAGLDELMNIHPDKAYFEKIFKSNETVQPSFNFSGETQLPKEQNKTIDKSELLITGGIILIGLALVLKLK